MSQLLTFPGEVVGSPAEAVTRIKEVVAMSPQQETLLRKNRGQFTASEDNLLLRGVVGDKNQNVFFNFFVLVFKCMFSQMKHQWLIFYIS